LPVRLPYTNIEDSSAIAARSQNIRLFCILNEYKVSGLLAIAEDNRRTVL